MSCLLHLSNVGRLSDHDYVGKEEGTKLMVDLIGADPADVEKEMVMTKGSHVRHMYLRMHLQTFRAHIADYEVEGNQDEVLRHQNFALRPICCCWWATLFLPTRARIVCTSTT
jgi:hypothetical protein